MRFFSLLLCASAFAGAAPVGDLTCSADLAWVLSSPRTSNGAQGTAGHGFQVLPGIEARLFDHVSLRTHAGYRLERWETTKAYAGIPGILPAYTRDTLFQAQELVIGIALQCHLLSRDRILLSLGASQSMMLCGEYDATSRNASGSGSKEHIHAVDSAGSRHVDVLAGVSVLDPLFVTAGWREPIRRTGQTSLRQVTAGLRYVF